MDSGSTWVEAFVSPLTFKSTTVSTTMRWVHLARRRRLLGQWTKSTSSQSPTPHVSPTRAITHLASKSRIRPTSKSHRLGLLSYKTFSSLDEFDVDEPVQPNNVSSSKGNKTIDAAPLTLQDMEDEIQKLNKGQAININSPKQVSMAIFGTVQSTSRQVLQQAVKNEALTMSQRSIAQLVLQHRELSRGPLPKSAQMSDDPTLSLSEEDALLLRSDNPTQSSLASASFEQHVQSLFENPSNKIHPYWEESLLQLTRPTARALVAQLDPTQCPMGFHPLAAPSDPLRTASWEETTSVINTGTTTTTAGKKGSFLAYCREQKEKYPDAIILTRCGDFYETYGTDAILLVEHCGLNAMAGKAKAGCPIRNVQATLDCLTSQGFRVAVFEEASDTDASAGSGASAGSKSRIKSRFLAQIVSAASPTYLYDLVLLGNADTLVTAPPARPYVGILSLASGYTLVEVSAEERSARVSDRLTAEAVACRLAAYPPADPLIYVPSTTEYESSKDGTYVLPFLPSRKESATVGPGSRLRTRVVPPALTEEPRPGLSELDRAKNVIVSALLQMIESREEESPARKQVSVDDFALVVSSANSAANRTATHSLYAETATQLGLMNDKTIPSLVSSLLPDSAPAATRRFLRRFLLTPPPPTVADAMHTLVGHLRNHSESLPPLSVPPVGKVLALIRAGQASAQVYSELMRAVDATDTLIETLGEDSPIIASLMTLLEHESGMAADAPSLRKRCSAALDVIEDIVSPIHHSRSSLSQVQDHDRISNFGSVVPAAFFERNELSWRGRVRREASPQAYSRVEAAASRLAEAVASDFWLQELPNGDTDGFDGRTPVVQDIFNNLIALREMPPGLDNDAKSKYIHPRDRNGKLLRNRYTTEKVQEALSEYVDACERARSEVSSALVRLSQRLQDEGHIPAVVQASHANLILSSALHHAIRANALGWNQATTFEATNADDDSAGYFDGVWPYWMDQTEAVKNSFDLSGMWLLTAPNMAGKSTILRSTAAAALLSACGLCAPLGPDSRVRRFDHLFVRGASADVPSERKSAFGAEMGDVAALLRSCGSHSLVFVDELGRGTSPRDGTRLAAAILEEMAVLRMSGVFATHLHEILNLPIKASDRIVKKRMAIHERDCFGNEMDRYNWTYRLEDGICTDSMALVTAARFGLPQHILQRAENFTEFLLSDDIKSSSSPFDLTKDLNGIIEETVDNQRLDLVPELLADLTGETPVSVPPDWSPPASLEGRSCVYVLQFQDPPNVYVGETDCFRQRLSQHRAKGGRWSSTAALVAPISGGKSVARSMESRLIQRLAKAGLPLISVTDGRTSRFRP